MLSYLRGVLPVASVLFAVVAARPPVRQEQTAPVSPAIALLNEKCGKCHSGDNAAGNLNITTLAGRLKRVTPGDPDKSALIRVVKLPSTDPAHMPAQGPALTDDEVATLVKWVTELKPDPRPIFKVACARCHNSDHAAGKLDLTTPAGILQDVKPGDVSQSELIKRVMAGNDEQGHMPKGGDKLPADDIATLRAWVRGMPDVSELLKAKCGQCHTGDRAAGQLDVTTLAGQLKDVTPGDPKASTLLKRIEIAAGQPGHMPANGPALDPSDVAKIEKWINYLSTVAPTPAKQ